MEDEKEIGIILTALEVLLFLVTAPAVPLKFRHVAVLIDWNWNGGREE